MTSYFYILRTKGFTYYAYCISIIYVRLITHVLVFYEVLPFVITYLLLIFLLPVIIALYIFEYVCKMWAPFNFELIKRADSV